MSALQRYANAQQLTTMPSLSQGAAQKNGVDSESANTSSPSFKDTLSSASSSPQPLHKGHHSVLHHLKQTGINAEKDVMHQIMGTGNLDKTAVSMEAAKTYLETVSHILRISVDKITELTTRTMGG